MLEADLVLQRAREAGLSGSEFGRHLSSKVAVLNYIRIADEIKAQMQTGTILDWGCGYGQMSFLLQRRGLRVSSYDVGDPVGSAPSPVFPEVVVSRGTEPVELPFPTSNFDAVLSCGVLEHVSRDSESLKEIGRVLRPGGLLFIYNLPQRGSYKEFLLSKLHLGYVHERKYTRASILSLLECTHWRILRWRRTGMLPQNLTPVPQLRGIYSHLARPILLADDALSRIPLLNNVAEALELTAVKLNHEPAND